MKPWVAHARADFDELLVNLPDDAEEASSANDAWREVPIAWRCAYLAIRGIHAFLYFFARPGFFGCGILLAFSLLLGSPPIALFLHIVVLFVGSAVVLWTQHRDLCGSWRTYLQTRFGATKRARVGSSGGRQARVRSAKPPLLLSAVLWCSLGIGVLVDREIVTRWSWEFQPQRHDYFIALENDSCDSVVTAAELRRRVTALDGFAFSRQDAEFESLAEGEDSVPTTEEPDEREINYSVMIRGLFNVFGLCVLIVAALIKWLDKRRW